MNKNDLKRIIKEEIRNILKEDMIRVFHFADDYKGKDIVSIQSKASALVNKLKADKLNVMSSDSAIYFPNFTWSDGKQEFGPSIAVLVGSNTMYVNPIGSSKMIKVGEPLMASLLRQGKQQGYFISI